ncbi:hypothetical protein [Treponema sp. R80B11-R83G3]
MKNLPEGYSKSVITRLTNMIISGDFNDLNIRELLIELREYSDNNSIFRELAHFIAHHKEGRKQGKFVDYIISYSQEVKFIWEYQINNKKFDLYKPFPKYILDIIYNKLNKIDRMELERKFNLTLHKIKKEIKKHIIEDEKTNAVFFMNNAFPKLHNVIVYSLKQIGIQKEILDQNIIIDDIIKTLKNNDISFNENEFKKMSNKIIFCILLLLHLCPLQIDENSNEEKPYCSILVDKLGNNRNELYLELYGILNSPIGDDMKLAFPIISTNLLLSEYCDDNLLKDILSSKTNNEITRPLEFNNFKLSYSSKSKKDIKNAVIFIIRDRGDGNKRLEIISLKDSTKHKEV